jgi:hypothetical protein
MIFMIVLSTFRPGFLKGNTGLRVAGHDVRIDRFAPLLTVSDTDFAWNSIRIF